MDTKILPNRKPALLVDDEPDVLVTTSAFLRALGFDVVGVNNGDEALAHVASGLRFALLVTDYAMPGLNGVDLATQALERLPALKILIMTGFLSDAGLFDRPSSVALLAKPFRRDELAERLNSLFSTGQTISSASPVSAARNDGVRRDDEASQRDDEYDKGL